MRKDLDIIFDANEYSAIVVKKRPEFKHLAYQWPNPTWLFDM